MMRMRNFLKKITFSLPIFLLYLYSVPFLALAQDPVSQILINLTNAVRLLVALTFLLALFFFAWGIVKLIMSAGDPDKVKTAKGYLLWGVIGLAVLASVFGLITFLQDYFGIQKGGGQIPIPTIQ